MNTRSTASRLLVGRIPPLALALGLACVAAPLAAQSPVTTFEYDALGNPTRTLAPLSRTTVQRFDALNRLTEITDPVLGVSRLTYDGADRLTGFNDPRNLATTYQYNGLGDLLNLSSPDSGTTSYTYDEAGNVKTATDARGAKATYTYDLLNRVTHIAYTGTGLTAATLTYTYDQGENGIGRLSAMGYPSSGSTSWRYDPRGRVLDKTQLVASFSQSVAYGYDAAGRLANLRYPSGRTLTYSWDGDKLTAIALDGTTLLDTVEYFPFGSVKGWRFANGQSYQRSLDPEGRISAYTLGPTQVRSLGYDLASRIRSYSYLPVDPLLEEAFDYDGLDRLITATVNATSRGYVYDANGNRSALTVNGVSYPYTVSPTSNRLQSAAHSLGLRSFGYDAAGLMSGDGRVLFTHDARARLIKVTVGTAVTSYLTDGKGQRIRKSGGPAGTVYFVFDEAGHLLGEYNSSGSPLQEFVWIGDTPVALITGAGTLFDNSATTTVVIAGTWTTATSPKGYQGANFHLHAAGGTGESFTWKINPPTTGSYRLYARWSADASRAPDARYTVSHAGGSTLLTADQRAAGGQWVELGTFNFTRNAGHTVRLDASINGTVSADAMKLVPTTAATYYVYPDHLDTPRIVTDTQNRLRWRWLADPFGGSTPENNPANLGALTLNLRFPGQYYDVETGLSYNFFRDYDPVVGRYVQSDPIGLAGGINTYTYVGGNPISRVDPFGLQFAPPQSIGGGLGNSSVLGTGGGLLGNGRGTGGSDSVTGSPALDAAAGYSSGSGAGAVGPTISVRSAPVGHRTDYDHNPGRASCGDCNECTPPKGSYCSVGHAGGGHGLNSKEHFHLFQMIQGPDCTCRWNKVGNQGGLGVIWWSAFWAPPCPFASY